MSPGDDFPSDDVTANAARRALDQLGRGELIDLSWAEVQAGARRRRQRSLSVLGAACAIVLVGASAAVAAIGGDTGNDLDVAGPGSPASSTSEPAPTTTLPWDSSSAASTTLNADPVSEGDNGTGTAPITIPTDPANDTTTTQVVLQPNEGSWSSTASVDKSVVTVGDDFVVTVELTNTGTQLQTTYGYSSYGIGCLQYPLTDYRDGLPTGQFFAEAPGMQPGETHTFSITFHAEPSWVGTLTCGAGYAYHGDADATFGYPAAMIEVVAAPDPTTTTTTTT
jgi:hypothetical protein